MIINSGESEGDRILLSEAKKNKILTGGNGMPYSINRSHLREMYGVVPMNIMPMAVDDPTPIQRALVRTSNAMNADAVLLVTRTRGSEDARALSAFLCDGLKMEPVRGNASEACWNGVKPFYVVYEDQLETRKMEEVIASFLTSHFNKKIYFTASNDLVDPKKLKPAIKYAISVLKVTGYKPPANRPPKKYN